MDYYLPGCNVFTFPAGNNPMMNPFSLPDLYVRLAMNPKTKAYLDQPDYTAIIEQLRLNPQLLGTWVRLLYQTYRKTGQLPLGKDSGYLLLES